MKNKNTVVLCLRNGGDFSFQDVELLAFHLKKHCDTKVICLFNAIDKPYELKNVTLIPSFNKDWPGWWTKMNLFNPEMEKYRPFLYLDLDTAIIGDLKGMLPPEGDYINRFITLGGFFSPDTTKGLQSGVMWFPKNNDKIKKIWEAWSTFPNEHIMQLHHKGGDQGFIRSVLDGNPDYWQKITNKICSFKIKVRDVLMTDETVSKHISVVCFHGQPRIPKAALSVTWVNEYFNRKEGVKKVRPKVTVIIPYKEDRGWLQEAIRSVPTWVQLIVSQGEGDWASNFNKALPQAEGDYIKYLHDDDMLTENCITDSVNALEEQGVDFIHGKAMNLQVATGTQLMFVPRTKKLSLSSLKRHNHIHSATTMYRKTIFDKIGGFDEQLDNSEEYEFNLRCLYNGFKIGYCDSVLAIYRQHPVQKSVTMAKKMRITGTAIARRFK